MEWMTAKQAAQYLQLSTRHVIELARAGALPGHTLSGTQRHVWRFLASELDSAMLGAPVVLTERSVTSETSTIQ